MNHKSSCNAYVHVAPLDTHSHTHTHTCTQDHLETDDDVSSVETWYAKVGESAKQRGVMTSVISIKGDECALANLGKVAAATGGNVDRVDPLQLAQNFSSLLSKPVIATRVNMRFFVHKCLQFRNEPGLADPAVTTLERDLGSVTEDSESTLEFGMSVDQEIPKELTKVPFQVQITFTAPNGMRAMRVITAVQEVTDDKQKAEERVNVEVSW